jgi:hypothetical protein
MIVKRSASEKPPQEGCEHDAFMLPFHEGLVISLSLLENREPTETRLSSIEQQFRKKRLLIVFWDSPLFVVIADIQGITSGPITTLLQ